MVDPITNSATNEGAKKAAKGIFGKTVDFIKGKGGEVGEKGKEVAHQGVEKGKEIIGKKGKEIAKEKATQATEFAKEKATQAGEKIKEAMHKKESDQSDVSDEKKTEENTTQNQPAPVVAPTATSQTNNLPRVAINGFGRIGRQILRIALEQNAPLDIVAINNPGDAETLVHLFKYDSSYGRFDGEVSLEGDTLVINGKSIKLTHELDPANLPWKDLNVDIIMECTGVFRTREKSAPHLSAGAKKVIISAPAKSDDVPTLVLGVNDDKVDLGKEEIISMASCTTNCITPVLKTLHEKFGIEKGDMCTIHSYTNDQNILDLSHKDLRRARAAALSIIPTTTGAAKAAGLVIPELSGKLNGYAVRVPTPTVSLANLDLILKQPADANAINQSLKEAANSNLKDILGVEDEPLVSVDYRGDNRSSIVDSSLTYTDGNLIRVVAWYDNEWGYSARMVDFAVLLSKHI